jgi:hypothetical protein
LGRLEQGPGHGPNHTAQKAGPKNGKAGYMWLWKGQLQPGDDPDRGFGVAALASEGGEIPLA